MGVSICNDAYHGFPEGSKAKQHPYFAIKSTMDDCGFSDSSSFNLSVLLLEDKHTQAVEWLKWKGGRA